MVQTLIFQIFVEILIWILIYVIKMHDDSEYLNNNSIMLYDFWYWINHLTIKTTMPNGGTILMTVILLDREIIFFKAALTI